MLHTCINGSNAADATDNADATDVESRARCKYFTALL
jgi:hypothetical protein